MSDDYLGIDVSKARLDVHDGASDVASTFSNNESGIAALVSYAKLLAPRLIVLEATGGLERALIAMLLAAQLPVAVVNPRQVRDFARASGQRARTDRIDARVLAHFARAIQPVHRPLPDEAAQAFADQLTRRRQLVEMLAMEKNRLRQAPDKVVRQDLKKHIERMHNRLRAS